MNKKLWFLLLTIFIDMLGVGILIPVIPQLLGEPNSAYFLLNPEDAKLGLMLLGLLVASYPISLFFASPVLGALSDRYGRRPVLIASITGTAISYLVFGFAILTKNIPLLFASRIVDGITGGNISVAQAAIADLTTQSNRARAYGLMGAAFGLGFIFGPFLGGILASPSVVSWFDASTPFFFSAIISTINGLLIYLFFKESIKKKDHTRKVDFFSSINNIIKAKKYNNVRYLFLVSFLFNAGFSFFTSFFNVYLTTKFNFSAGNVGNFFAYVGIWIIITQLFVVRPLSKRFSEHKILGPAYICSAIGILLYFVPQAAWGLLIVVPLASIPNGLQHANFTALLTKSTDENVRGEVLGINSSVNSLGQSIPPLLAGVIAAATAYWVPIVFAAIVVFIAGVVFFKKVKVV